MHGDYIVTALDGGKRTRREFKGEVKVIGAAHRRTHREVHDGAAARLVRHRRARHPSLGREAEVPDGVIAIASAGPRPYGTNGGLDEEDPRSRARRCVPDCVRRRHQVLDERRQHHRPTTGSAKRSRTPAAPTGRAARAWTTAPAAIRAAARPGTAGGGAGTRQIRRHPRRMQRSGRPVSSSSLLCYCPATGMATIDFDFQRYVERRRGAREAEAREGAHYAYAGDLKLLRTLERLRPVTMALEATVRLWRSAARAELLAGAVKASQTEQPLVHALVARCAERLHVTPPTVYVAANNRGREAHTLGTEDEHYVVLVGRARRRAHRGRAHRRHRAAVRAHPEPARAAVDGAVLPGALRQPLRALDRRAGAGGAAQLGTARRGHLRSRGASVHARHRRVGGGADQERRRARST